MILKNKLGINNPLELVREEEKITKIKAKQLFEEGILDSFEVGTFKGLSEIHKYIRQILKIFFSSNQKCICLRKVLPAINHKLIFDVLIEIILLTFCHFDNLIF